MKERKGVYHDVRFHIGHRGEHFEFEGWFFRTKVKNQQQLSKDHILFSQILNDSLTNLGRIQPTLVRCVCSEFCVKRTGNGDRQDCPFVVRFKTHRKTHRTDVCWTRPFTAIFHNSSWPNIPPSNGHNFRFLDQIHFEQWISKTKEGSYTVLRSWHITLVMNEWFMKLRPPFKVSAISNVALKDHRSARVAVGCNASCFSKRGKSGQGSQVILMKL